LHNKDDKPTANIVQMGKTKTFPQHSGMRQSCLLSPLLSNIVLAFSDRAIRPEKVVTDKTGNLEVKLFLLTDDMILCLRDYKNSTRRLLHLTNTFNKVAFLIQPE
jgi:hypothetical protein